jgi:hypothetical protein
VVVLPRNSIVNDSMMVSEEVSRCCSRSIKRKRNKTDAVS